MVQMGLWALYNWTLLTFLWCYYYYSFFLLWKYDCVSFCGTAKWIRCVYMCTPGPLSLLPTPRPTLWVITEPRAELPVTHSSFPLAVYLTHGDVHRGEGNGTPSSVLAWRIPGMGEPGGLPSMGLHRVGHDWSGLAAAVYICQWCSLNSSHSLLPPHPHPQLRSLRLHLYSCPADSFKRTTFLGSLYICAHICFSLSDLLHSNSLWVCASCQSFCDPQGL